MNILIDPRIFISPPYITCPKCGSPRFGILMICDNHYCRRCKACLYPRGNEPGVISPLPVLRKKIIYLDQFAISNMMKALNPRTKAFKKGTIDRFWLELFERLDSLCRMQLIVCPDSRLHIDESLLSPHFDALKRLYELLSHGATFYSPDEIKRVQLYQHAKNWASGTPGNSLRLDARAVIRGKVDAWHDRLIISVRHQFDDEAISHLREHREKTQKALGAVFSRWQSERDRTFEDWFEEECLGFARVTLQLYVNHLSRLAHISLGGVELTVNDLFPPSSFILMAAIHDAFRKAGISEGDVPSKTIEYLRSPHLKDVPFIRINSMLFAAVARKAAAGMQKPPDQGLANDIKMLSVLLPYCNAMFIDNECHTYLKEMPLAKALDYGTRLYSLNNKEEFIAYLSEIESTASRKHLKKVDEVYGRAWRKPYTTLYKE